MMRKLTNPTNRVVKFQIANSPGEDVTKFEVAPGETVEVPEGYCEVCNGRRIMDMLAPALVDYVSSPLPPAEEEEGGVSFSKRGRKKKVDVDGAD